MVFLTAFFQSKIKTLFIIKLIWHLFMCQGLIKSKVLFPLSCQPCTYMAKNVCVFFGFSTQSPNFANRILKHHTRFLNFSCVAKIANVANSFLLSYPVQSQIWQPNSLMDAYHFSYITNERMSHYTGKGRWQQV